MDLPIAKLDVVRPERNAHVRRFDAARGMYQMRDPHEFRLAEYIACPVLRDADLGPAEIAWIDEVRDFAEAGRGFRAKTIYGPPAGCGISLVFGHFGKRRGFQAVDRDARVVGAVTANCTYVKPELRGRGIGTEMILANDHHFERFIFPQYYSEAGFASRVAAHRRHLQRACDAGIEILDAVMADYLFQDGKMRLKAPYTIDRHMAAISRDTPEDETPDHYLPTA